MKSINSVLSFFAEHVPHAFTTLVYRDDKKEIYAFEVIVSCYFRFDVLFFGKLTHAAQDAAVEVIFDKNKIKFRFEHL